MFSQLKEEFGYIGGKGFWAVPVENGDGGASMNNGVPKMYFGRGEVKDRGDPEGNEAEGLEMRE